jgi:hypothetical protein
MDTLELGTSFYVYQRSATVHYFRSNLSIFEVTELSPPIQTNYTVIDMAMSLLVLVNNTGCPFRLAHWASVNTPSSDSVNAAIMAVQSTRTAFALVFHYFNANMVGGKGDSIWLRLTPRDGLPPNMYTVATVSRLAWQTVASRRSLWLFVSLDAALLLVCLSAIILSHRNISRWPRRTGFAIILKPAFYATFTDS